VSTSGRHSVVHSSPATHLHFVESRPRKFYWCNLIISAMASFNLHRALVPMLGRRSVSTLCAVLSRSSASAAGAAAAVVVPHASARFEHAGGRGGRRTVVHHRTLSGVPAEEEEPAVASAGVPDVYASSDPVRSIFISCVPLVPKCKGCGWVWGKVR
jgi:hypothetical protein